jgi:nitronate monooxygenase
MGTTSGGTLAKAVTEAGGLGIMGFGYGNQERIDQEFRAAGNARVTQWARQSSSWNVGTNRL